MASARSAVMRKLYASAPRSSEWTPISTTSIQALPASVLRDLVEERLRARLDRRLAGVERDRLAHLDAIVVDDDAPRCGDIGGGEPGQRRQRRGEDERERTHGAIVRGGRASATIEGCARSACMLVAALAARAPAPMRRRRRGRGFARRRRIRRAAIGGYSAGCIDGAVALPKIGDGFRVAKPERNRVFGHPLLVG